MTAPRGGRPAGTSKDPAGVSWRRLHLWQIQPIRDVLLILMAFGLLYIGYKIRLVTVPLLVALLLAYLFEPVVMWLTARFKWMTRRMAAGGLIAVTLIVVIVPLTVVAAWGVAEGTRFAIRQTDNLAHFVGFVQGTFPDASGQSKDNESQENTDEKKRESVDDGIGVKTPPASTPESDADKPEADEKSKEQEQSVLGAMAESTVAAKDASDPLPNGEKRKSLTPEEHYEEFSSEAWRWAADLLRDKKGDPAVIKAAALIGSMNPVPSMAQVRAYLGGMVSSIAVSITLIGVVGFQLFLTAFFFFFISSGYERVIDFIEGLIPVKHRARTVELARKMDKVIAGFVRGRLLIAIIQGVFFSVAYLILGVPAAIILGLVVGVLSIVPYLALIGIPISIVLLFLDGPESGVRSEWWFMLLAPVGAYFVIQALDDYVWTPMIQGKSTGLDTPTVLFASIAGGALAGFYGLLIAIPVAACVKILVQEVVWPRFKAWREGKVEDPLPLGGGE